MRVLFITNYYPPYEIGGYEQLCRDVVLRLVRRGHAVQTLTSTWGLGKGVQTDSPPVHRILRLQPNWTSRLSPAIQFFVTRRRAEIHNRQCLCTVASRFIPNVIFIWNLQCLPRSIAAEAESMPNVTVAYWLAGYSPTEPDEYWQYWTQPSPTFVKELPKSLLRGMATRIMRAEQRALRLKMHHVGVVSEYERRKGITNGTLPPHTQVIYNGIEVEQFFRPVRDGVQGPLHIVQAGRVSPDKGVHTSVEAIGHLVREYNIQNVHLHVIGSGPAWYLASLQDIVRRYHIGDKVTFLGWQPREKMPELMSRYHVMLLSSPHQEPFARVMLEGMAAGLAVVGTLTGGTGELLQHEVTGLTFSANNSRELAEQIKRLAAEPGLRQRLAVQGQKVVLQRFSLDRMVDNIERFLEEALSER